MILRIIASILLLYSILALPFWVFAILSVLAMAYFSFYAEAVIIALISDLLYGVPRPMFFNIVFVSFLVSLTCFIILELLKKKLRFAPRN